MVHPTSKRLKIAGTILLIVPISMLALLAIGEVAGGDLSGLQHAVQLAPLAALCWLAWRSPRGGGIALVALALLLALMYLLIAPGLPPSATRFTIVVLFAPPLVAGILFILAARWEPERPVRG